MSDQHAVVILDRQVIGTKPEYCVHGHTTCVNCEAVVWLGHKTVEVVQSGKALPLCLDCATAMAKAGLMNESQKIDMIRDHRRADGPHT